MRVYKRQGRGQWTLKATGADSGLPPGVMLMSEPAVLRLMGQTRTENTYFEVLNEDFTVKASGPAHLRGQVSPIAQAASVAIQASEKDAEIARLKAELEETKTKRGRKPKTEGEEAVNEDA